MKRFIYFLTAIAALSGATMTLSSCSETEDTTPSYADKDRMETLLDRTIPAIADFADKYGTYMLYDFNQQLDFAYQFEQSTEWNSAEITRLTRDEAVVAADFLCANVFNSYSDEFKKKYFPRKMLLTSQVKTKLNTVLGRSIADDRGYHQGMANINSVTLARLGSGGVPNDPAEYADYIKAVHSTLLASYLVEARAQYPANDNYYKVSTAYYSSLMTPNRTQAGKLGVDFFHEKGFFFPEDDHDTYFASPQHDMVQFIDSMICMNQAMHDEVLDVTPMAQKVCILANGLKDMGVDITGINPLLNDFMDASLFGIAPTVTTTPVIANSEEATLKFIIYRGARDMVKAEVSVNGGEATVVDLMEHTADARIGCTVLLKGLEIGNNDVTVKVYETGRTKPALTEHINILRVSLTDVQNMVVTNSEKETWSLHQYIGYDYTTGRNNDDIIMMRFYKRATSVNMDTGEETGRMHHFWRIHKDKGLVTKIDVLEENINYETFEQTYDLIATYEYKYNEVGQLTEVTKDGEPLVTDVAYIDGNITRYTYNGKPYSPVYATAECKDEQSGASYRMTTRVDCLDEGMTGKCFKFTGTERLNPYYIDGLPAVIPGNQAGIPLQILYSRYLFNSLEGVWSNTWELEDNSYYTIVTLGDVTWNYRFVLKQ